MNSMSDGRGRVGDFNSEETPVSPPNSWPTEHDLAADERTAYEAIAHRKNVERQRFVRLVEDAVDGWREAQGIGERTSAEHRKVVDKNKFYNAVGALNEEVLGWPPSFFIQALQRENSAEIIVATLLSDDPKFNYRVKLRLLDFTHPDKEEKQGLDFIVVAEKINLDKST